ncbi:hypothetical protein T459_27392 [Capsicum annuum]|uniref:Uncharacterized protein n=1 Tax=Capsicum annuum TaxID=4072 RepID=A0A2G2YDU4_CAPAN|nr:hypothetical protein T459_27392 [Capsicum annuum]
MSERFTGMDHYENHGGKGLIDLKAHNGKKIFVKKRKLRDPDCLLTSRCNGNDLGDSDANAVDREVSGGFRKQKKSKFSSQQPNSVELNSSINRSNREKDHLRKKYRVEHQCQAEFGMIHKQVCKFSLKKTLGYRKEVRTCTAI